MQRGLLTGIILGVAMTIFALQNSVKVEVKFLWLKFEDVPLALILVISIMIGVILTAVFAFIDKQRLQNKIRRLLNKIKKLEDETVDDGKRKEAGDLISDDGMTIEGEPGHKFFDD
ncbi:MAG TPA: LapA family protein [Prolixibacteraceae bacterium]|nr:LapA family protein [Prolixibacteraceae bacterium]